MAFTVPTAYPHITLVEDNPSALVFIKLLLANFQEGNRTDPSCVASVSFLASTLLFNGTDGMPGHINMKYLWSHIENVRNLVVLMLGWSSGTVTERRILLNADPADLDAIPPGTRFTTLTRVALLLVCYPNYVCQRIREAMNAAGVTPEWTPEQRKALHRQLVDDLPQHLKLYVEMGLESLCAVIGTFAAQGRR